MRLPHLNFGRRENAFKMRRTVSALWQQGREQNRQNAGGEHGACEDCRARSPVGLVSREGLAKLAVDQRTETARLSQHGA